MKDRIREIQELEERIHSLKSTILTSSSASLDDTPDELNFLLMRSDGRLLAAPLMYIDEVLEMPGLSPLPNAIATMAGLINYHGSFLAVIDVRSLLSQPAAPTHPDHAVVICTVPPRQFALKVDETIEVITVTPKDITVADKVLPGVFRNGGMIRISDRESALILDIAWLAVGAELAEIVSKDAVTPIAAECR